MENLNQLNLIRDNSLEYTKESNSLMPIYEVVKDYYSFWYNYSDPLYYTFSGTLKLYKKIINKTKNPLYARWGIFINLLKNEFNNCIILESKNSSPSYSVKIVQKKNTEETITLYISMNILGSFYTQFIVQETSESKRVYIAPDRETSDLFIKVDDMFKSVFNEYLFVSYSLLRTDFFGLIVPSINEPDEYDGKPTKIATMMDALFFPFDMQEKNVFYIGDKRYKSEYLSWTFDKLKNDSIKNTLLSNSIEWI